MAIYDVVRGTHPARSMIAAAMVFASPTRGQEAGDPPPAYTLVPGDIVSVDYGGTADSVQALVDIDGQIRMPGVGAVGAASLTLDALEAVIESRIVATGQILDPAVTTTIAAYAPIVIAGDVGASGRYDYLPGMTVATAIGLGGGLRTEGAARLDLDRARAEAEGQQNSAALAIAAEVVRLARLDTTAALPVDGIDSLEAAPRIELSDPRRAAIPAPATARIAELLDAEQALLDAEVKRALELGALWTAEIAELRRQEGLLHQRIAVQDEIVAQVARDLEAAEDLQARGLRTASQLSSVQQRDADARARRLEIESALTSTFRAISDAQQQRAEFFLAWRLETLRQRAAGALALGEARLRYDRALAQSAILGGDAASVFPDSGMNVAFRLVSARPDRNLPDSGEIEAETPLLPGDTLVVTLEAAAD
ncbi:polysaccharide biosynthesis/export family protein [Wenxinia marina]|nr:polysaccharide biosynthesis/export family protein [Wenxinia marina]GGL77470.1 sugar ABC transporter substrate-binding protein [Wenxinia marina]